MCEASPAQFHAAFTNDLGVGCKRRELDLDLKDDDDPPTVSSQMVDSRSAPRSGCSRFRCQSNQMVAECLIPGGRNLAFGCMMNSATPKTVPRARNPRQQSKARTLDRDTLVGQRIRELRKSAYLTLGAVASELGVTYQQLQKYEKGVNRIGAGRLLELARVLGVPIIAFFAEDPEQQPVSEGDAVSTRQASELAALFLQIRDPKKRRMAIEAVRRLGGS